MIEDLKEKVLCKILVYQDIEVHFYTECGKHYKMHHVQDCCENVYLNDIIGDLCDLIGSKIIMSEETVNDPSYDDYGESSTWTFYKFATVHGYVTLRWIGTSNGHYSESVYFDEV